MHNGHRILVVEDYAFVASRYVDVLQAAGLETVGPAVTVEQAKSLVAGNDISAALLDIRLEDGEVWPVAKLLVDKHVPFTFCTGYFNAKSLPAEWAGRPLVNKPLSSEQLLSAVTEMLIA